MPAQLPPKFQPHPEQAVGIISIDDATTMIKLGWLTYEGACYVLPPRAWMLLPKPPRVEAEPQHRGWLARLLTKESNR
jgi:hypothetical protein